MVVEMTYMRDFKSIVKINTYFFYDAEKLPVFQQKMLAVSWKKWITENQGAFKILN